MCFLFLCNRRIERRRRKPDRIDPRQGPAQARSGDPWLLAAPDRAAGAIGRSGCGARLAGEVQALYALHGVQWRAGSGGEGGSGRAPAAADPPGF